jgi:hypothetical protein
MRYGQAALIAVGCLALVAATEPPLLENGDFEQGEIGQPPPGWTLPASLGAMGYRTASRPDQPHDGAAAARLWREAGGPAGPSAFGSLSQNPDITRLRGHRFRYSASVRIEPGSGPVGLWARVDGADGKPSFFDNMMDRPIRSGDWSTNVIEGYVPPDAKRLLVGLLLNGDGGAWIDTAKLEDLGAVDPAPTGEAVDLAPTAEARAYLDRALDLLQARHVNTAKADWPKLRTEAYAKAAGAGSPRETYAAIWATITALGERHTFLRPPSPPRPPGAAPPDHALPVGQVAGHVADLALPGLHRDLSNPGDTGAAYQQAISAFLRTADAGGVCGWVIDLREHNGGDMWPGMRGLAPLLGPGSHGAFINARGAEPWPAGSALSRDGLRNPDAPVAVLLGPKTGSSGEMMAIAFAGRPATRSFGQPTAGFTTANSTVVLSDGAVLAVTSAYVEDRLGRRYEGAMTPDETTTPEETAAAAAAWLGKQGCATR